LDELAQELRRSALSNDLGSGAGFHVWSVSGGDKWRSGHATKGRNAEASTWQLKNFYYFMHLLVYKLSKSILASFFGKIHFNHQKS
jgi:hypothetical protein